MVGEGVQSDFAPGFAVQGGNLVQGQWITLRFFAAVYVEQQHRSAVAPRRGILLTRGNARELVIGISGELHSLRRKQPRRLMMSVTGMHTAPPVDDHGGTKAADHLDHVLQNLVAPN